MTLVVIQVTITNEDTGIVEQTLVEAFTTKSTDSWEASHKMRPFLTKLFDYVFPGQNEW